MENENAEVTKGTDNIDSNVVKQELTHALGLQDLYKAAFSQETVDNYNEFNNKASIISTKLIDESDFNDRKIEIDLEKTDIFKNSNFHDTYQLYSLKALEYSVDFVKPEEHSLDLNNLNFEETKIVAEEALTSSVLSHSYESFQNVSNSVLDLDKGIQIHLVKAEGNSSENSAITNNGIPSLNYNFENCEYTGDSQILQKYLCDSANITNSNAEVVTLNFLNNQNNNISGKNFFDSDSVGVNPETLGVRFEDCDFNSSDSFASTESIIPKNIKCPKCPKKFMFKSDLLRHDKYKHSAKPKLFCKYCNKEFVSQQNLLFHEKSHKKKKNSYKCEICKKIFKKSAMLIKHMMKKHSKSVPFSCNYCQKIFSSQILLNNHLKKCHLSENEKPFKCEICFKSFEKKQGLSCHVKAHVEEHSYTCQQCNKSFSKICYLKNHQKSHHEEKDSFTCDTCGKDFKTSSALEEHSRKHTGEKPFTCNVCLKSFAYKAYFKVHIKKHSEVKPYSCSQCQKGFVTSADLTKHEKCHRKDKPYHCINCNQDFSQQSNLINHWKKQKCSGNKSQEVCTQTTELVDGTNLSNVTLQNVNVIVDQSFATQQPILLTPIGSLINSNSVPVILTQNPSETYSASSIT